MTNSGSPDRRRDQRFNTTMEVDIRFQLDGTPVQGSCIEIGPNGMRVMTSIPLVEAAYVHISFQTASNNTFCEGRVVWTESRNNAKYESGIDIQRWGGGIPGSDAVSDIPNLKPQTDRRKKPR